jgi:cystathionine gamma-synthase
MFKSIPCGETLPQYNIHAVSVSIPTFKDVVAYEEGKNTLITRGYPRFILHPYLKEMTYFLKEKYFIKDTQEIVLVSSQKFAKIITEKYKIQSNIKFKEDFGIVLVDKNSTNLKNVLSFIQHVGCNLSSRYAEDFLFKNSLIEFLQEEELENKDSAFKTILSTLASAYNQPEKNICLSTSGMNSIYAVLQGLQDIRRERDIIVQLGWLYLDCINVVKNHSKNSKVFYDVSNLKALEEYLQTQGGRVLAIITEVPTNPLLQSVDLQELRELCDKYNISLVIDATFATPFNLDLKKYADVIVESLTKFACGNADVLMGCFILNENLKYSIEEFTKYIDKPYIKDMQRLAVEIQNYESRVKKINKNKQELVKYLCQKDFVKNIYTSDFSGVISVTFNLPFDKVYDNLNFCKGPSLGTEFTLLMPYIYLAHYDLIKSIEGKKLLAQNNIPIDLIRISVGIEDIEEIKQEFDKLDLR